MRRQGMRGLLLVSAAGLVLQDGNNSVQGEPSPVRPFRVLTPMLAADSTGVVAAFPAEPGPTPEDPEETEGFDDVRATLLGNMVNQYRVSNGLTALTPHPALDLSARDYARVMALNQWDSHTGPDGSTFTQRNAQTGYRGSTNENYVYSANQGKPSFFTAELMMEFWKNSASHKANMLSTFYKEFGMGCFTAQKSTGLYWTYCVMEFGSGQ